MLTEEQKIRYSRQILSPSFGEKGQEIISKVKVLQIGAGGLGSPFSLYLVASGIGELTIIDNDVVSISNLQRQILYNETQIGRNKVEMAKDVLSKLNHNVKINIFKEHVDDNSIKKHLRNHDFIVDCSDNLRTKFLVNQVAVDYNIRCVISGIKDFFGQIMTINPKKSACYQCVFSKLEDNEIEKPSSTPLPVIGITPGILGTMEALEVIKTALGLPNLENKLLMVNLLEISFNVIDVARASSCICS